MVIAYTIQALYTLWGQAMKIDTIWHLIDSIATGVIILDDRGVIQYANNCSLNLLRSSDEKHLLEMEFDRFLTDSAKRNFLDSHQSLLEEKEDQAIVLNLVCQDGIVRKFKLSGRLVPDQDEFRNHTIWTIEEHPEDLAADDSVHKAKLEDMQWLADQGRSLLSLNHWSDILDVAGQALQKKIGNCFVLTFTKEDEASLRIEGIYGLEKKVITKAWNLIGGKFYGRVLPMDERYIVTYSKRELHLHGEGLEEFAISMLPKRVSRRLVDILGVEKIYTIGLEGNQQVLGCFYIFTLDPDLVINSDLVESFAFQVALALERTKYAVELKFSEKQFQTIFESAPDGYYLSDLQGNFIDGNLVAENMIGYDREEMIGKNFLSVGLLSKEQIPNAAKLLARNLLGKPTGPDEFVLTRKDGRTIPVEISTHPLKIGEKSVVLGIARDISHRKEAEETLIKSQDSLTRVLEGIDAHVYVSDLESYEILYMNKKMIEDFGGDFTGKPCYEVFRGENRPCPHCTNPKLVNELGGPGEVIVWENQNVKTKRWYRNYDRAIYWTDQRLVRMEIAVDISDNIEASKALELSEQRYRSLFETSHNAIMTMSPPNWEFASGNAAVLEMFGFEDQDQFLKCKPWELFPETQPDGRKSDQLAEEMLQIALDNGSNFFHWVHKRIDGEEFPATVQLTRVDLDDTHFIQATVRDISEQIEAEKKIKQQMDDLALLNTLNIAANQGQDLRSIFKLLARETKRIFQAKDTTVYLLNQTGDHLMIDTKLLDKGLRKQIEKIINFIIPEYIEFSLEKKSTYKRILNSGEAQILSDKESIQNLMVDFLSSTFLPDVAAKGLKFLIPNIYQHLDINNVLLVPLKTAGDVIGLIDMSGLGIFTEDDKERFIKIAEQISGIIQRVGAETDRTTNLKELELIYRTFIEGNRIIDIDEVCQHLAEKIHEVNSEAVVMVTLYDPDVEAIRVRGMTGIGEKADRLLKLLGKELSGFLVKPTNSKKDRELNELFTSGKLELIPNGLYDLVRGTIPKSVCHSAEKLMGVDRVYVAGFGLGKVSVGGLVLFVKEGQEINYSEAIETIVNHFAIIFDRRQNQREILQRKAQLEALREVELDIASQLNIEELLNSISRKAVNIVNAKASGFCIYNHKTNVLDYIAYWGFDELPEETTIEIGEGLSGKVWLTKETLIVENYAEWEGRSEKWAPVGHYYIAGIPVCWGEEILGVLEIALDLSDELSPGDIEMLELFAAQAAVAIKNARLYSEEQQRRREAEILSDVGMQINQMMSRAELLDMILTSLQKVVPYDSASVQLVKGKDIIVEAFRGTDFPEKVIGTTYTIEENKLAHPILYEGKKVILENRNDVEDWLEGPETENVKSWLAVPLEIKGSRIGILTLDHYSPGQYTEDDADLALDFANQAAIALENNRLFEAIRERTREIEVVYESALILAQDLHPEELYKHLYEQVETLFDPDAFILATYEHDSDMIRVSYATEVGVRRSDHEGLEISPQEKNSLLSWIIRKRTPLLIGNVETDSLPVQPQQRGKTIRSWLGIPLMVGDRIIGALVVQSYQAQAYTHDDRRLLQLLGNQVGIALENSRLYGDAQRRLSRLTSLREVDQAISGSVDLEFTMDVLLNQLLQTLEVDAGCVMIYKPDQEVLEYSNCQGFRAKNHQQPPLRIGEGLAGKAAKERTLIYVPDLEAYSIDIQQTNQFKRERFLSYFAQPLIAKGELVGVLEIYHRSKLDPDPEWMNFLDAMGRMGAIAIDRLNLYNNLAQSNIELSQAYDATIEGWARAIELRDGETEGHSRRVVSLMMNLARTMGVSWDALTYMRWGALLHDIGKMAIPDGILLNPGKLSEEEWGLMKKHPLYANEMLSTIEYLKPALDIPLCHHERWDGTGYPQGLSGEDIPLGARIFAVVDVWDALQSDRPYRPAWTEEKAAQYIKEESGKHFDPRVVEAFFDLIW